MLGPQPRGARWGVHGGALLPPHPTTVDPKSMCRLQPALCTDLGLPH
jgi:hypothetical protein